jgi:glycosyltransferase involved in cell wall biosynthesis
MPLPFVSVIIPIYNGEADLPDLLRCLQAQTYPADRVEYLLIDNGSADRTFALLQAAPHITALRESQIQSSYAARNQGIRAAQGEILCFTDADCRPEPDWLMNLVPPFENGAVGWVAGEVLSLPGKSLLERYADRRETLAQKHTLGHAFLPYGQTANLAVRAEIFTKVGLFRPYLTTGGDADICWRISQATQCQWGFAPTAIVRHRHRHTLRELRSQWRRYGTSNRYLHDLHGVALQPRPSGRRERLVRWLLKELPNAFVKGGQAGVTDGLRPTFGHRLVTALNTPLDLICQQARWQGQVQAQLPEPARTIARLTDPAPQITVPKS